MIPLLLIRLGVRNPHGFIAQVPVEVVRAATNTARLAQVPVEVLRGASGTVRIAQMAVEIIKPFNCETNPQPPGVVISPTQLIRRERWFPVLALEQNRVYFSQFQIDLETGNGARIGQGDDPKITYEWSDDGGHTWSHEHFMGTGAIGAYRTRAKTERLGASRSRVYRISVSDPVPWSIINGRIDLTPSKS